MSGFYTWLNNILCVIITGGGGEGRTGDTSPGPMKQLLFSLYRLHHMLFLYLSLSILHCLDSVREHVGRTLSNAFTVGVDKLFDALNTSNQLTDHATCIIF